MKLITEEEAQEFATAAGLTAALLLVPCLLAIVVVMYLAKGNNCQSYGDNYYKTTLEELGDYCTDGSEGNFKPVEGGVNP